MMRRCVLTCMLAMLLPLCGCLESKQVNQYGYVQSIGLDKGESKKYAFSFLMQQASASDMSSSGDQQAGMVIGAEGDTLFEAVTTMVAGFPYELNFTRTDAIFFSDEVARAGGMKEILQLSQSALKMRHSMKYFVILGSALDFQKGLQTQSSPSLTQIQHSVEYNNRAEGISPLINHALFYEAVTTQRFDPVVSLGGIDESIQEKSADDKTGQTDKVAKAQEAAQKKEGSTDGVPREGGMRAYIMGSALFDGLYMKGTLNGEETKYLLMARGELHKAYINFVDSTGERFSIHITQEKKPKTRLEAAQTPHGSVYIPLTCEIHMSQAEHIFTTWETRLKAELTAYMEDAIQGVFASCRSMGCDAIGFGRYASLHFSDSNAWRAYEWKKKYGQMQADFQVELVLHDAYMKNGME
ncbi:MAG: Ger(x)C family spore germination C-terminal domain-containing protein [Clostridia bacterium]|nr:Ger(x)C family spore germination C-terminal domain-containing protein [Clostridia bacterium]